MQLKKVLANSAGNGSAFAARQLNADSSSNINIKTQTRLFVHFLPPLASTMRTRHLPGEQQMFIATSEEKMGVYL